MNCNLALADDEGMHAKTLCDGLDEGEMSKGGGGKGESVRTGVSDMSRD